MLEVLIALSIIALALMAMFTTVSQSADAANTMRDRTYASWIAQNKITELRLANVLPEVTTTSGDVDYASRSWRWRAVVSETGIENLYRVDVEVTSADSNAVIRTVTGFIGEPVIPGQSNRAWGRGPAGSGETQ